ncbi:hypothetical protein V8E51_016295 [Hyaloscypha variabilis]
MLIPTLENARIQCLGDTGRCRMAVENYGIPDEELPVRMWRDGIHRNFEPLRHQIPASLGYMLPFIYLAYSMMAFLYEAVPVFEDTWIECLGDFGRYRMAIEDIDIRDREV